MVNAQNAHSNKANFQYANSMQSQMVAERKSKKSGGYWLENDTYSIIK